MNVGVPEKIQEADTAMTLSEKLARGDLMAAACRAMCSGI